MSSALFRSKAKDKRVAGKEPLKSSTKLTRNGDAGGGATASGSNPLLRTFHTLDTASVFSVPSVHANGRLHDIDDTDDSRGNSVGVGFESDSVSNNGSRSGEPEDPKERASRGSSCQEAIRWADSDRQEKTRQKNEKKHQRHRVMPAQELHERCCGYLMSRKLEALTQQLVAMGFLSERAMVALILNEARVEESVTWLTKGGEGSANVKEHNFEAGGNLKLDISQELAQIADMEVKFKCSKQEVERAVVMCEGDLKQAAESLTKVRKQESPAIPPKPEETRDLPTIGGGGKPSVVTGQTSSTSKVQSERTPSTGAMLTQQKTYNKNTNYPNKTFTTGQTSKESGSKNIQLLKKTQPNSERAKQQEVVATPFAENRWPVGGLHPSVSSSLASSLQAAPPASKIDAQYASIGNEFKNLHLGSVREPVIVQRPQSNHIPNMSMSSSLSSTSYMANRNSAAAVEPATIMNPNGIFHTPASTRSFYTPSYGSSINNQLYDQFHYQHHQQQSLLQQQPISMNHLNNNGMWNRTVGTSVPEATSSSGLFFGLGSSNGASRLSNVDWNTCLTSQFDYTNVDWSVNRSPPPPSGMSGPNVLWMKLGFSSNADFYASGRSGETVMGPTPTIPSNGNDGISLRGIGLHPDGVGVVATSETPDGGSCASTSPCEEKHLFNAP